MSIGGGGTEEIVDTSTNTTNGTNTNWTSIEDIEIVDTSTNSSNGTDNFVTNSSNGTDDFVTNSSNDGGSTYGGKNVSNNAE